MQDEFAWIWLDRDWRGTSWDDVLGTWRSYALGLQEGDGSRNRETNKRQRDYQGRLDKAVVQKEVWYITFLVLSDTESYTQPFSYGRTIFVHLAYCKSFIIKEIMLLHLKPNNGRLLLDFEPDFIE